MSWQCVRLVCKPLAPIHTGWHRLGLIERTRYYIPARNVWGAVVSALAKSMHANLGVPAMYKAAQKTAKDSLRFTYLFPGKGDDLWRPGYEHDELLYGGKRPEELESRLVYSEASAAIAPEHFTALDGALHETEYLALRDGVRFSGYIFLREPITRAHLAPALNLFEVGGERRYGWGVLEKETLEYDKHPIFGEFKLSPQDGKPLLKAVAPFTLPAHLIARSAQTHFRGELEAHSGRDWGKEVENDRKGAGQDLLLARPCWVPGTYCDDGKEHTFTIRAQGLWEEVSPA